MSLRNDYYALVAVFCVALISAYFCFVAAARTSIDEPIRGDARDYAAYAYNLKTYNIFSRTWPDPTIKQPTPDAVRSPGYPFFLSFFVDIDKQDIAIDKVGYIQALITVITTIIYMLLFYRFMPITYSIVAGIVTAISPHLINASVYLLTETLFTFLLGAHLFTLEKALSVKGIFWASFSGIFLALSLLIRPTTQFLFIVYILIAAFKFHSILKGNWRIFFCLVLPAIVATTSWSIRNIMATGHASDSSLTANFLQHGMYINMMYNNHPETYGYPYSYDPKNQEIQGNVGKVLEAIGQHFKKEPRRYLAWVLIGKPIEYFSWNLTESVGDAFIYAPINSPYFDSTSFRISHQVARFLHPLLMFLAVIGAFVAIFQHPKNNPAVLLSVIMLYFIGFHMIGAPFPRYSIPLRPISYGLALYTIYIGASMLKNKFSPSKDDSHCFKAKLF